MSGKLVGRKLHVRGGSTCRINRQGASERRANDALGDRRRTDECHSSPVFDVIRVRAVLGLPFLLVLGVVPSTTSPFLIKRPKYVTFLFLIDSSSALSMPAFCSIRSFVRPSVQDAPRICRRSTDGRRDGEFKMSARRRENQYFEGPSEDEVGRWR